MAGQQYGRKTKDLYVSTEVITFIQSFDKKDKDGKPVNEVIYKLNYLAKEVLRLITPI